jgi:hypothetical protein
MCFTTTTARVGTGITVTANKKVVAIEASRRLNSRGISGITNDNGVCIEKCGA